MKAGSSDTALAWTDGERHIWFERRQLPLVKTAPGRLKLANIMVHEFLHREPDTETHVHDVAFYHLFHDIAVFSDAVHAAAEDLRGNWERGTRKAAKRADPDDAPVVDDLGAPDVEPEAEPEAAAPAMGR